MAGTNNFASVSNFFQWLLTGLTIYFLWADKFSITYVSDKRGGSVAWGQWQNSWSQTSFAHCVTSSSVASVLQHYCKLKYLINNRHWTIGNHHTKVQNYWYCSQNTENDSKVSPVKQHVFTEANTLSVLQTWRNNSKRLPHGQSKSKSTTFHCWFEIQIKLFVSRKCFSLVH